MCYNRLTISDTVVSIADPGPTMSSTSLSNPAIFPAADPLLSGLRGVAGLAASKGEWTIRLGTVNTPLSELIGKLRRQFHRNRGNKYHPCSPNISRTHTQTRRVCRSRSYLRYGQPEPRESTPRPVLGQAPAQVDHGPARVDARHDTEHWGHLCISRQFRMCPSPASKPLRPACLGTHLERTGIPVTGHVSNHCPSSTRHHGQRTNVLLCRHLTSCPAPRQPSRHPLPRGTGSKHLQGPTQC